jgi:hypothetical protein
MSNTDDYLVRHALKNVWCSPRQDLQVIYTPRRISNPRGERVSINHLWGSVMLPTNTDVYHVYQIGQYAPHLVGLKAERGVWHHVPTMMHDEELIVDIYTSNGVNVARLYTWIMITPDKDILVAVRDQPQVVNLRTTPIHVRLYSNSFFSSVRSDDFQHQIYSWGRRCLTPAHQLEVQRAYHEYMLKRGHTWLYVNGIYRDDYTPSMFVSGDIVEFVYDSTVKAVKEWKVKDLDYFDSARDNKRKYFLHYAGDQVGGQIIDYQDDIDVFLIKRRASNNARFDGLYYHKNNVDGDAMRMVTHRDYSIVVDYVVSLQQSRVTQWPTVEDLSVQLFIREGGYARPLVFEHHRIQELYKLKEPDLYQAMVGVDSSVHWWKANELENSLYVKIMGMNPHVITNDVVRDAYGYNAIAKLIGDTPKYVVDINGRKVVPMPYGLQVDSTVYELDANGLLIAPYVHRAGVEYTPFNASCRSIEAIGGIGGGRLDLSLAMDDVVLQPNASYRFYVAPILHDVIQWNDWEDVTGDETKYTIIDGKIKWLVDPRFFYTAVKSDTMFLSYELNLAPDNGLLRFSVNGQYTEKGVVKSGIMYIPPGRLDIWLNSHALIEGLDYYVQWPQVVICNKEFLVDGKAQKLRIRGTGFCNPDMSLVQPKEVGFVKYGKLSHNSRFDLRDDRVIRLVVRGGTYNRDKLLFNEDTPDLWMDNVPNGSPYTMEDLVVPLRGIVNGDTYELMERSREVDAAVSAYLTQYLPEPVPENPDPIPERYTIYSPFASTVMYDLLNGRLSYQQFMGQYSDQKLREFLASYEWLLDYDPCIRDNVDLRYVCVHPHDRTVTFDLNIYQYNMLRRAIRIFLNDKVDISHFVRIKDSYVD